MAHSIHMAQNDIIFHRKYMQTDENIKRNSIYHTQRIHILQNEYIHLHIRIHIVFVCAWHKFVAENYYT